jgi:predicted Rossmann fold nucleotide-binding protein DprA/Smf involved in DNA uptake
MSDIELFKIIFDVETVDFASIKKLIAKFNELSSRPSFKNKHFIEYSLKKDRIVDFELEEMQKNKEKYSYIYEEKYPDLEIKLKHNIENIPFVLTVLERIDTELDEIKNSRGVLNVVNRILNYIEIHSNEEEIKKTVKMLRNALKS